MSTKDKFEPEMTTDEDLSQEQLENVRQRAYELFEARGRDEGHDLEDWLQAEAEVVAPKAHTGKA